MRTTLTIDTPILDEIKQIQKTEGGSLGRVVTELLSEALVHRRKGSREALRLDWVSKSMDARVDLSDRDAIYEILDSKDLAATR